MLLRKNSKDQCEGENKALEDIWRINGTLREVLCESKLIEGNKTLSLSLYLLLDLWAPYKKSLRAAREHAGSINMRAEYPENTSLQTYRVHIESASARYEA